MKLWQGLAAIFGLGAFAIACNVSPSHGRTAFTTRHWRLVKALIESAKAWGDKGVLIAKEVKVSWGGDGVPVRFASKERLARKCQDNNRQGCPIYTASGQDFKGLYILDGLDDARLSQVVMHEMMHILVPDMPHLPPGVKGVMSTDGVSSGITDADLEQLSAYTTVEPVQTV